MIDKTILIDLVNAFEAALNKSWQASELSATMDAKEYNKKFQKAKQNLHDYILNN